MKKSEIEKNKQCENLLKKLRKCLEGFSASLQKDAVLCFSKDREPANDEVKSIVKLLSNLFKGTDSQTILHVLVKYIDGNEKPKTEDNLLLNIIEKQSPEYIEITRQFVESNGDAELFKKLPPYVHHVVSVLFTMYEAKNKTCKILSKGKFYIEQVEDIFNVYDPSEIKCAIQHINENTRAKAGIGCGEGFVGSVNYIIDQIEKLFLDDKVSRNIFLELYVKNNLLKKEKECNRRDAEQEATNELLQLTVGKTAQEIKAMIKVLKHNRRLRAA
jgi:hypothetical protein